jgi:hypothetical protein
MMESVYHAKNSVSQKIFANKNGFPKFLILIFPLSGLYPIMEVVFLTNKPLGYPGEIRRIKMRRTISFFIGVIMGGLVGATIALLFAPNSGTDLRDQIRERAESLSAEVRQAAGSRRIELQERLDTLRAPRD